jgi:hypothetical protein
MNIGEMVERLVKAGCDPVAAASVVAEVFTAGVLSAEFRGQNADETAERRRAKDRDRKRLLRGNPQTSAEVGGIPQKALTLKIKDKKVRAAKHPLSADFQPKDSHFDAAAKLGCGRQYVLDKCEDMRIWAASSGALKADWDATLHGFIRRDAPKVSPTAATADFVPKWDEQVARFLKGHPWSHKWYGPEPGQAGCRVPVEILKKHGVLSEDRKIFAA